MALKVSEQTERMEPLYNQEGTLVLEGMFVDIPTTRLANLCAQRAEYHERKRAAHQRLADARVKELGDVRQDNAAFSNVTRGQANDDVTIAAFHRQRKAYFLFLSKNLVPNVVYRFDETMLNRMELLEDNDG